MTTKKINSILKLCIAADNVRLDRIPPELHSLSAKHLALICDLLAAAEAEAAAAGAAAERQRRKERFAVAIKGALSMLRMHGERIFSARPTLPSLPSRIKPLEVLAKIRMK